MKVGVEPRSRDCDHTVAVKRRFYPLGYAADKQATKSGKICQILTKTLGRLVQGMVLRAAITFSEQEEQNY